MNNKVNGQSNITVLLEKLVKLAELMKRIEEENEKVRQQFIQMTQQGASFQYGNYIIEHAGIKKTITDEETLAKLGFDLNRVRVTITKVDPKLVKVIGEQENKKYYTIEDRVIIRQKTE